MLSKIVKKNGRLKEAEAKDLVQAVAITLKYCHEIGVAHRDIRPENIMVGATAELSEQPPGEKGMIIEPSSSFLKGQQIMLIDFALAARCVGGKKVEVATGTLPYMSPELLSKEPHCPKKSDVWALGVLAYKIVTGEHPFHSSI